MNFEFYLINRAIITGKIVNLKLNFSNLTKEELSELILRFPYTISKIIKYGTTNVSYSDLRRIVIYDDCYVCGITLFNSDARYEYKSSIAYTIDFICEKCFKKINIGKTYG